MLYVNDDIADDLFRQAAENYPLKTDNADWDAVYNKMHPPAPILPPEKKKRRVYLLLLLLLIPLLFAVLQTKKTVPVSAALHTTLPAEKYTGGGAISSAQINTAANINTDDAPVQQASIDITPAVADNDPAGIPATGKRHRSLSKNRREIKNGHAEAAVYSAGGEAKDMTGRHTKEKNKIISTPGTADDNDIIAATAKAPENTEPEKNIPGAVVVKIKAAPATTEKQIAGNNKKTAEEKKKNNQQHFYAGLIGGPDLSTIKMQRVKEVGYSFGLLAGYRLNKKLSIETGLLKDKKYYDTRGEYFSTSKLDLEPDVKIHNAAGSCNMLELPVNIHYVFRNRANSSLFASAGVSSYFMNSEAYVYSLTYYNYSYPESYRYKNKSTTLFAAINISAGYTHRIGRAGDLRIEPYIKLPVNKIGTGNLPIQSAGIYIGFTKSIF